MSDSVDKWVADDLCEIVQDLTAALVVIIGMEKASELIGRLDRIREALGGDAMMMDCYTERAHLLALLARTRRSRFYIDPKGEDGFKHVLAIQVGQRWLTWHIADGDLPLFDGVDMYAENLWDGHTTEEKYAYIRDYLG